ncbi:class I adenylate-forming enzyme family protein [Saccharothrix longispora]|uniref:class I adenylate-forming enzyme family protein n=1 Tax=Saccharothrix longispora TaxID=33920 RepID=UPI0028FD663E|nr:AMP-binding protein [Saccharothrix longispora]MBY8848281.1 AMP-binding protein [Saccharothrix sp. MB29]MDU0289580.1 AMP-binding protein [Saccharothrix longispora]
MSRLVTDLLDRAADRVPDSVAVVDGAGSWTYRELREKALDAAAWLAVRGARPGDRVVVRVGNVREFVALLFGTLYRGAVVVPLNPAMKPYHVRSVLADAEPAVVVTDPAEIGTAARRPTVRVRPTDLAALVYTSGSTSTPKGVISSHDAVLFATDAIASRLRYRADDVVLTALPLSFDYALYQVFLAVSAGCSLVLSDVDAPARLLGVIKDNGVTVVPVVPSLAGLLVRLAGRGEPPSSVRLFTNTGAALAPASAQQLRDAFPGARVVPMYGITECKRVTIAEPDRDLVKPGSVGTALPGTEVLIVDGAGAPCPPGTVGQIVVRGPHVMAGYWRAEELTAHRFPVPATLHTGDYGHLDADGELFFEGRRDDLFKRRGVRMSAREVEAATLDIAGVTAAAVLPPGEHGDLAVVAVTGREPAEVLAGLRERLEDAKVPAVCRTVECLPLTPNGKTDLRALAELLRSTGS